MKDVKASKDDKEVKLRLVTIKQYEKLTWLGLLFWPLALIFFILTRNEAQKALILYDVDKDTKKTIEDAQKSARNIFITITGLYVIIALIIVGVYTFTMESQLPKTSIRKY